MDDSVFEPYPNNPIDDSTTMSVLGTLAMQYADRLWVLAEPVLVDEDERATPAD